MREVSVLVKITRITTQKNNSERFSIFIDKGNGEEFGFGVDQDVLIIGTHFATPTAGHVKALDTGGYWLDVGQ